MYFNDFRPAFVSTLPAFGASFVMGGVRPGNWFGGWMGGMGNWMGNWSMGRSCGWAEDGWWRPQHHRPDFGGWHSGGCGAFGPWGSGAHGCHAPREGGWNSARGGYTVGPSGQLDVTIEKASADFNNRIQYSTAGGEWRDLGFSKDDGKTATIYGRPGSNVQFRIQTPQNNTFLAGTTANIDGQDHGKITAARGGGVQLGFEDYANDKSFDDAIITIKDRPRWR